MARRGFDGRSVLLLESRRARELGTLVSGFGGRAVLAPALQEVPLEAGPATRAFIDETIADRFDAVIFLTGAGARLLLDAVDAAGLRQPFAAALNRTRVLSRGPKPMPVLRELGVSVWAIAPEPNTWREIVATLDTRAAELPLAGSRIALQEYGGPSQDLIDALTVRGAAVTSVLIYHWALPDDVAPLREAVAAICGDAIDVLLVTSGIQVAHLWAVADTLGQTDRLRERLAARVLIGSIGPAASDALRRHGLEPDLEAAPPKMGVLVTEAATRAGDLLEAKRGA